jgi:hypothetical protein
MTGCLPVAGADPGVRTHNAVCMPPYRLTAFYDRFPRFLSQISHFNAEFPSIAALSPA